MLTEAVQESAGLALYLSLMNLLALVVTALSLRRGTHGPTLRMSSFAIGALALAGGAAGTTLALFLFAGRITKESGPIRFLALGATIAWLLVCVHVFGIHRFSVEAFRTNLGHDHTALLCYLVCVNLITSLAFAADKARARRGAWRIPEAVLLGLSFLGGAPSGIVSMHLLRHKLRSPQFSLGLPSMLPLQAAVISCLVECGIA